MRTTNMGLLIALLLFGYVATAQDNLSDYVPRSPEAEALFKYQEIPISLFTGTPKIDIPLLGFQEGN